MMKQSLIACCLTLGIAGAAIGQVRFDTPSRTVIRGNTNGFGGANTDAALGASTSVTNNPDNPLERADSRTGTRMTNDTLIRQNNAPDAAESAIFNAPTTDGGGGVRDTGPRGAKQDITGGMGGGADNNSRNTGSSPVTPLNR